MRTRCPHCGGKVRLELSVNFLVCKLCCEMLYVNELVPAESVPTWPVDRDVWEFSVLRRRA